MYDQAQGQFSCPKYQLSDQKVLYSAFSIPFTFCSFHARISQAELRANLCKNHLHDRRLNGQNFRSIFLDFNGFGS